MYALYILVAVGLVGVWLTCREMFPLIHRYMNSIKEDLNKENEEND